MTDVQLAIFDHVRNELNEWVLGHIWYRCTCEQGEEPFETAHFRVYLLRNDVLISSLLLFDDNMRVWMDGVSNWFGYDDAPVDKLVALMTRGLA